MMTQAATIQLSRTPGVFGTNYVSPSELRERLAKAKEIIREKDTAIESLTRANEVMRRQVRAAESRVSVLQNEMLLLKQAHDKQVEALEKKLRLTEQRYDDLLTMYREGAGRLPKKLSASFGEKREQKLKDCWERCRTNPNGDPDEVIAIVCGYLGCSFEDLKTSSRKLSHKRQFCWYFLEKHTRLSHESIGALFNKERTTVSHGIEVIKADMGSSESVRQMVDEAEALIQKNLSFYNK